MKISRDLISDQIIDRLTKNRDTLKIQFDEKGRINSFILDNLLSEELISKISSRFPKKEEMVAKKNAREYKYVAAQMNKYDSVLEEALYSFQRQDIVDEIGKITSLKGLTPDEKLYAGGISLMAKGNYLNPHLDNSHDMTRENYRVLNLLFYVTPDWKLENGGNLELWDNGIRQEPREILSKYNRLVVMVTNKTSLHSVNKVAVDAERCCVSNYYFSPIPAEPEEYFHVTSFYGRPEEKLKSLFLNVDSKLRGFVRKFFPKGIVKNKHFYDKQKKSSD